MSDPRVELIESLVPAFSHSRSPAVVASLIGHDQTSAVLISRLALRSAISGRPEQTLLLKHSPTADCDLAFPLALDAICAESITKFVVVENLPPIVMASALALAVAEELRLPTVSETTTVAEQLVPLVDVCNWRPRCAEMFALPWLLFGGLLMAEPRKVKLRTCLTITGGGKSATPGGQAQWSREHLLVDTPDGFRLGVGFHALLVPAMLNALPENDVLRFISMFVDTPARTRVSSKLEYGEGQLTLLALYEKLGEFFWEHYLKGYKPSA